MFEVTLVHLAILKYDHDSGPDSLQVSLRRRINVHGINSLDRLVLYIFLVTKENVFDFLFRDLPQGASVARSSRLVLLDITQVSHNHYISFVTSLSHVTREVIISRKILTIEN